MAPIEFGARCQAGDFYQGYAYAPAGHRLLYRESHWLYTGDGVVHRLGVYSCATHELRDYSGVSNICDAEGRNLSETIWFPRSERRDDAAPAEIEHAAGQPLAGRCVLQ
jgi:hypothetical protein